MPLEKSKLRRWRLSRRLSLQDVSDLTGLSVAMLSRVERGERRLSPITRVSFARCLGVRVRDLFDPQEIVEPDDER